MGGIKFRGFRDRRRGLQATARSPLARRWIAAAMAVASVTAIVGEAGAAGVARSATSVLSSRRTGPITPATTRIPLGSAWNPAKGVTVSPGQPERATRPGATPVSDAYTLTITRESTTRFSALGVTWAGEGLAGVLSVAMTARGRSGWPPWRLLGLGETSAASASHQGVSCGSPNAGGARRAGTDLVWTGPALGVAVSVTIASGWATPDDLGIDLIDPVDVITDATAGTGLAVATQRGDKRVGPVAMPGIVRRAAWRAAERPTGGRAAGAGPLSEISLRGLDLGADYAQSEVPRILRALYHYATACLGASDLDSCVIVDRFGRLWQAMAGPLPGALSRRDDEASGAAGFVARIAVLQSGEGRRQHGAEGRMTPAAIAAVGDYAAWRLSRGPLSGPAFTAAAGPERMVTARPGPVPGESSAVLAADLSRVRERVAATLGSVRVGPTASRRFYATWRPADATWWLPGASGPALTGTPGDVPVPADYDGDGERDPATWSPTTGSWRYLRSTTGAIVESRLGAPGDQPVPADYDGDGEANLATFSPGTGTWRVSAGPVTGGGTVVTWGRQGDTPVPADYDGDGRAEIAVWRPAEGTWHLRGLAAVRLGSPWHVPVPEDFDGDGRVDVACWSPVSYHWFIATGLGSGTRVEPFGQAGDVPVPGDYDGDGRADLSVLHPLGDGRFVWRVPGGEDLVVGAFGERPIPF